MGVIPYQTRRVRPSGRTGGARIPIGVAVTGKELTGQGLQQLGRGLSSFGGRLDLIDANNQLTESTLQLQRSMNQIDDLIRDAEDSSENTYSSIRSQILDGAQQFAPKNARARRAYNTILANNVPAIEEFISNGLRQKAEAKAIAMKDALLMEMAVTGNALPYFQHLEMMREEKIPGHDSKELLRPMQVEAVAIAKKAKERQVLAQARATAFAFETETKSIEYVNSLTGVMPREARNDLISQVKLHYAMQEQAQKDQTEKLQEASRDKLNDALQRLRTGVEGEALDYSMIDNSGLPEAEQGRYTELLRVEVSRLAKGEDIVTDSKVRAEIIGDITDIMTGSKTKQEVMQKAVNARYAKKATLSEKDFATIQLAIEAEYSTAYGHAIGAVKENMRGRLLRPDSLGLIPNAPIRYEIYSNALVAFFKKIAQRRDELSATGIIELGIEVAAAHQVSDERAEQLEVEMEKKLKKRETKKKLTVEIARRYLTIAGGDREEAKRLAAEDGYVE